MTTQELLKNNDTLIDNEILINLVAMHDLLDRPDLNECRGTLKRLLATLEYIWIDEA